jgi:AcrR family transcriptional regulator
MRADAQRNRERILEAAEEVFAGAGPDASTEEVARRAGVAIGTVFRHFPTKADLLRALIAGPLGSLSGAVGELLVRGQEAGAVASGIRLDEVMALLVSACQGALLGGWDADLRRRTLDLMLAGLRPTA